MGIKSLIILVFCYSINAQSQDIKITQDLFKYSPNSITGVYVCTPLHVENGDCRDVDQEYYDNLARITLGSYEIGLLTVNGVKTVAFKGPLSPGAADNLLRIMKNQPDVETLILSSEGGSEEESYKIADFVKSNKISTWVPVKRMCLSACVAIFLSGEEKILDGQLGMHMASFFLQDPYQVRNLEASKKTINKALYENNVYMMKRVKVFLREGISLSIIDSMIALKGKFLIFTDLEEVYNYNSEIDYQRSYEEMLVYLRAQDLSDFKVSEYIQLF